MYADPSGHTPEWLSDVGRFIGGLLISAASIGLMVAAIGSGGLFCLFPGYGALLQAELSLLICGEIIKIIMIIVIINCIIQRYGKERQTC